MAEKKTLGRGLNALLGDATEDYAKLDKLRTGKTVPIEQLHPGKYQPRHRIDATAIDALAQSIREKGILQPLLVRRDAGNANSYEIIAGERRWRAAQLAKLHELPVIIRDFDDQTTLEVAVIENIQREDLSPIEEADAFQRMIDEFGRTQEEVAQLVGKSRPHIANTLRLLALNPRIKAMVDTGELSAGHARTLIGAKHADQLADIIVAKGMSVREAERLVKRDHTPKTKTPTTARTPSTKDVDTLALERSLANVLGLNVAIENEAGGGRLIISYETLDQLDFVIDKLTVTGAAPTTRKADASDVPTTPPASAAKAVADRPSSTTATPQEKPKLSVSLKPKTIQQVR
ncbi:MAG: ParB/RepB/Spo0J family partition protein [Proteobacteria bacterium]|nr:ParB/RepB/Spo0J family partition protein [Pseudomonadota bacterium]